MLQAGQHPGKTNLTDVDNGLTSSSTSWSARPRSFSNKQPCGAAEADSLEEAYRGPTAPIEFGVRWGLVVNRPSTARRAEQWRQLPGSGRSAGLREGAVDILRRRAEPPDPHRPRDPIPADYRRRRFVEFKALIDGGIVGQQSPLNAYPTEDFKPAVAVNAGSNTGRNASPRTPELADLLFGWSVEQGVTSTRCST